MKSSTGLLTLMCDVHYEQQSQSNNADKIHLSLGNIQVKASEKANQLHKYAHTSISVCNQLLLCTHPYVPLKWVDLFHFSNI
jgi:hypothetical protein